MFGIASAASQNKCGVPVSTFRALAPNQARITLESRRKHCTRQLTRSDASGAVTEAPLDKSRIHEIPKSRWPEGIPPVMGAHLMDSGKVAPISTSKGPGLGGEPHMFFYPDSEADVSVVQYSTVAGASNQLTKLVAAAAQAAIKEKGSFAIALTGGSLLKIMGALAGSKDVDWPNWHVFFGDERNVPHTSPDSTIKGAREGFLSKVPIPEANIHAIREGLPVQAAATEYEGQMLALPASVLPRNEAGWPVLDMVVLGLGPDGHICSLFPNRPQTAAAQGWILPVSDSPKPPSERITMSLPVVNAAKHVVFVALGEGKAEIVQRVLEVQSLPGALPAQMVRPAAGKVTWLLDSDSASAIGADAWIDNAKAFPRSNMVGGKKPTGATGEAQ